MREGESEDDTPYGVASDGTRTPLLSLVVSAAFFLVGTFGVGLIVMTALALVTGTATLTSVAAGVFGAAVTVFAGHELLHRHP